MILKKKKQKTGRWYPRGRKQGDLCAGQFVWEITALQVERLVVLEPLLLCKHPGCFVDPHLKKARDTQFTLPGKDQANTVLLLGGNEKVNKETEV